MQDVEAVDFFNAGFGHCPSQRTFANDGGQRIALFFAQFLGVVETGYRPGGIEDHRGGDHRPGQRSAPGFVDTTDEADGNDQFRHSMTALAAFSAVFWRNVKWISVNAASTALAFSLSSYS